MSDTPPVPADKSGRGRVALWGGASCVAACLLYAGFVYPKTVMPDAGTWIGMANVHLEFAQSLPAGNGESSQRSEAIQRAEGILADVEKHYPGLSITAEFRAFAKWIEGDVDGARSFYLVALDRAAQDRTVRARITSNLASLEIETGHPDDALAHLRTIEEEHANAAVWATRARAWDAKGITAKRSEQLQAGFASAKASGDENEIFVVAECAAQLGDAIAGTAFEFLSQTSYRARYRLAMLKIDSGDSDRATSMLSEVAKKTPRDLALWIQADREYWDEGSKRAIADKVLATPAKPNR